MFFQVTRLHMRSRSKSKWCEGFSKSRDCIYNLNLILNDVNAFPSHEIAIKTVKNPPWFGSHEMWKSNFGYHFWEVWKSNFGYRFWEVWKSDFGYHFFHHLLIISLFLEYNCKLTIFSKKNSVKLFCWNH